jgi:iron complex outermembrane receptor protein
MVSRVNVVLALAVGAVLASTAADAQVLEEIVVTAQKREQSLQDVGISVAAFSGDQLKQLGATSTVDITQQVPALRLFTFSPAFTVFSLRGVSQNNFQDNLEAPVAVYMDGAYVATMNALNAQMFDMERVEVLRGPQGTLFGRNATGGLIHFLSRKATEDAVNGYLEAGAAEFDTYSVEGAIGGGLSDRLRGRLAGRWQTSDGYVEAGTAVDPFTGQARTATGRTSDGANGYALRGNLQFDATDDVLVDLTASYSDDHDVPSGQYVVSLAGFDINTGLGTFHNAFELDPVDPDNNPPIGPFEFDRKPITGDGWHHWSDEDPYFDRETTSITAQVTAKLGGAEFVSVTNYLNMDKFYIEDSGGGFGYFPYNTINDYDQWSQEFRLSGETAPLNWTLGAYYLDMTWDTFQSVAGALILGGTSNTQKMSTYGIVDSRNWSVFGQLEYALTDHWTVVAGLRWSQDDKSLDMRRVYEDVPEGIPPTEVFNIKNVDIPGIDDIDYGDYAARLQVNWRPVDGTLLYLSYNRGIKGGNWSLDPLGGVLAQNLKHKEEVLDAYELGLKTDLFGGIARLNASAFYYDYHDYQAFSITGLTPQVSNSDADATGGEIEFVANPITGLDLMLGAAFIDSTVDAVPDVFGGTVKADLPNAPSVSINALARYEWPAFGGALSAQVDGIWNDDQFLEGTNSEVSFEPSYSVWNANVSYRTGDEHVRATVYVKNFTDEEYRLYDLDLGLIGFIEQVFAPPRQFGLTLTYSW